MQKKLTFQSQEFESTAEAASIALVTVAGQSCSMGRVASSCHPEKSHRHSIRRCGGQVESLRRDQRNSMCEFLSEKIENRVSKRFLHSCS